MKQIRNSSLTSDMVSRNINKRHFIQPLAVALVSLVFTLLFFKMPVSDII